MEHDWLTEGIAAKLLEQHGSPLYLYDLSIVDEKHQQLQALPARQHYAIKANDNPDILRRLQERGCGIEAVSPGACQRALDAGFSTEDIIVTCNAMTRDEMRWYLSNGIRINIDSVMQLRRFAELGGKRCGIRINQGIGAGFHEHVVTGGPRSKFGIGLERMEEVRDICEKERITIIGLHQHIGSSILDPDIFVTAAELLFETAMEFEDLEYLDIGGGFGIPYARGERALDVPALAERLAHAFDAFVEGYGMRPELIVEPGKFLVAESGILLCRVEDIKRTPHRVFIGLDTGMNHLIRTAMYDAYHRIVNLSNPDGELERVNVVGNVCETSDWFAEDTALPEFSEGDTVAIHEAGAYGYTMSSHYNQRGKPAEVVRDNDGFRLSRERETFWEKDI